MNYDYWRYIPAKEMEDLIDLITANFKYDEEDPDVVSYVKDQFISRYREFKCELHDYYSDYESAEEALANPPKEMLQRKTEQWPRVCAHFQSERFLRQSKANKTNRALKPFDHRTGSRPLSYLVDELAAVGSKFAEVDAFEIAYGGKNKEWKNAIAKAKHAEMLEKKEEYLRNLAEEYPEGTPLEDIPILDTDAGLKIMTSVLGVKSGCQIRGLGKGRRRELRGSSSRASIATVQQLQKTVEEEKAARVEVQQQLASVLEGQQAFQQAFGIVTRIII